jgi:hypothetical protein
MYITRGTLVRPAGMPMNFSPTSRAGNPTKDIKEYSSIRLKFPDSESKTSVYYPLQLQPSPGHLGVQAFIDDFANAAKNGSEKRQS